MQVRLIVPNNATSGRWLDPVVEYGRAIADIAGGFTAFQATGGWLCRDGSFGGKGDLIQESVTVFDVSLSDEYVSINATRGQTSIDPVVRFRDLARRVAQDLQQESVYLSINGKVEYITP